MKLSDEDNALVEVILNYCNEIYSAIDEFHIDEEKIMNSSSLRAMLAFFLMQIGETANHLSSKFIGAYSEIEWRNVINLRHRIAHAYGRIIPEILWDTVQNDIPELKDFCEKVLNSI